MEWIKASDKKPEEDCLCYVTNVKAGWESFLALYQKRYDVFILYDPNARSHPPIDVTHWFQLPESPPKE